MPERRTPAAMALGATAAVSLVLAAGAAAAPVAVHCGQKIVRDTVVAGNLVNCPHDGLVIGAGNVTLDLNGHTIDGDGTGDDVGIANRGHGQVTIENGSIRQFVEGVLIEGGRNDRVRDLSTSGQAHSGITVAHARHVLVDRNHSAHEGVGVIVFAARDGRVSQNTVADPEFAGIAVFLSDHVLITGNRVTRSFNGNAIGLFDHSHDSRVERNVVTNGVDAIALTDGASHNSVSRNRISDTAAGVIFDAGADHNLVTGNDIRRTVFVGIGIASSDDNRITKNTIAGGGDGEEAGIHVLTDSEIPGNSSDRTLIGGNVVTGYRPDGIGVDAGQRGTVIAGNRASDNVDDGIDVDAPTTVLLRNIATRNRDLGIDAVAGIIDRGGNRASGNGNPLQCVNAFCR